MLKRLALLLTLAIVCGATIAARAETPESPASRSGVKAERGVKAEEEEKPAELIGFQKDTAIWTLIIFIVLLAVLYPTAWKNVLAGLKAREERIRKDIADAEASRLRAESTLKDYNAQLATAEQKVREMINSAAVEGERIATQIKMQAQQDAEAAKERATREIETAKKQAIQEIYSEAATLSTNIAEKILRRNLNPDDQRDLVSRSLEQLQGVGKN